MEHQKNILSKEEILSTEDWYLSDHINLMEGYFYKKYSILNDGYTFYMRRYISDGHTMIYHENGNGQEVVFDGYIYSLEDLLQVKRLLRLDW